MIEYYESNRAEAPTQPATWPWLFAEAGWAILCAVCGALFVIAIGFTLGIGLDHRG